MNNGNNNEENDVSNADVIIFKNNTASGASLSEVGSLATSAQQQPDATTEPDHRLNTTSNTGTVLPQDQPQSALLNASMNSIPPQFLMQIMQVMQQMSERLSTPPETKIRINDIYLPSFDPDTNVGVREWCQHIDKAIETYRLNDFDIRMKVGSLLKGRAKMWVDDWMVTTASWAELRNNLITTFEPENRYSRDIVRFREHVYDSSKDISEFLSRAWVLWRRITKDKLSNEDAVEAVIGCVNDERLRIELLNTRATTVPELISVASSIRTMKRAHPNSNSVNTSKRPRFSNATPSTLPCRICKRSNHTTSECYYKPTESKPEQRNKTKTENNNKEVTSNQNNKTTICSFCKIPGHSFETCFKRERSLTSNVNYIAGSKLAPIQVKIGPRTFQAVFDSGAECSLIRESIAAQLPGKRLETVNYLRGIGQFPVLSIATLVTIGVIDNINVELQFYIVADYEMTTDILIGMNLINNTNLTMMITSVGTRLTRLLNINQVQCMNPIFDKLDCDLTSEEDITKLRTLLNKYQHLFIRGVAPLTLLTQRRHCVPPELLTLVNIDEQTIDIEALTSHVQQKMSQNAEQDKQRFNSKKAKIRQFQRGDYVLIKNNPRNQTSLDLKFSEPYEITKILNNDRYLVKKVVGSGRPRKVAHDQLHRAPQPGDQMTVSAEEDDSPASTNEAIASTSRSNIVEQRTQEYTDTKLKKKHFTVSDELREFSDKSHTCGWCRARTAGQNGRIGATSFI
ncbi:unnamed protein product, partial [Brenthis ino]